MNLNMNQIAESINLPLDQWPGNCYAVAIEIISKGIMPGKAVYGFYTGPISCELFAGRRIVRHGWIKSGPSIIDPTRWVFEAVEPYIYVHFGHHSEYDFGGNNLRKMFMGAPPSFVEYQPKFSIPTFLFPLTTQFFDDIDVLCAQQVAWLASLPLDSLGNFAKLLYEWIIESGSPGFIPIDNRMEILGHEELGGCYDSCDC